MYTSVTNDIMATVTALERSPAARQQSAISSVDVFDFDEELKADGKRNLVCLVTWFRNSLGQSTFPEQSNRVGLNKTTPVLKSFGKKLWKS